MKKSIVRRLRIWKIIVRNEHHLFILSRKYPGEKCFPVLGKLFNFPTIFATAVWFVRKWSYKKWRINTRAANWSALNWAMQAEQNQQEKYARILKEEGMIDVVYVEVTFSCQLCIPVRISLILNKHTLMMSLYRANSYWVKVFEIFNKWGTQSSHSCCHSAYVMQSFLTRLKSGPTPNAARIHIGAPIFEFVVWLWNPSHNAVVLYSLWIM